MMTQEDVPLVLDRVRRLLAEKQAAEGVHLAIDDREYRLEDDWLYVIVSPTDPGTRALVYADALSQIEKQLRREHFDHVLLVPSSPDVV